MAISPDAPEKSRSMAKRYGIEFPLLEDKDLKLAKQYAGVSSDGYAVPSVYILRADGSVYLQKIGDAKDDRIYAAELLEHLDTMLGPASKSMPKARGFAHPYRVSANVGLGAHALDDDVGFATDLSVQAVRTLGAYLGIGAEAAGLVLPERELRAALLLQAQRPMFAGVFELYVQVPLGWTKRFSDDDFGDSGFYSGVRGGTAFDVNPNFQLRVELAVEGTVRSGQSGTGESTVTPRALFRTGAAWRF